MTQAEKNQAQFFPVTLKNISAESTVNFNMYLQVDGRFVLYRNRDLLITRNDINRLLDNKHEIVYVNCDERKEYRDYLERSLPQILESSQISSRRKAEVLYEASVNVISDVFADPRSEVIIKRSKNIVKQTVDFVLKIPDALENLLLIREHDFYTFTHSVNVCAFLIALARENEINDLNTLNEIGEGGLLHDLGKSMVPAAIINKQGPLDHDEWEVMKKHPNLGMQIACETRKISPLSLTIIGQHHEKLNGAGYPDGKKGTALNLYARMASIVDVYDAITTNRSYQQAKTPLEAARIMLKKKDEIDQELLSVFIRMIGKKKEKNEKRIDQCLQQNRY